MTIKEYLRGVEAAKMVPAASGEWMRLPTSTANIEGRKIFQRIS